MSEKEDLKILKHALKWAESEKFRGYSKFDALSSPFLYLISIKWKFLRHLFIYLMSRSPINLRPFFGVQKKHNPKGLALFSRTYFNLYKYSGDKVNLLKGLKILLLLLKYSQRKRFSGHCWGYEHHWQSSMFFAPAHTPNTVVTVNVCEAFLEAYRLTKNRFFLDIVISSADFLINDLDYFDVGKSKKCCSYIIGSNKKVINVNAMTSSFLSSLYVETKEERYKLYSKEMMNWVVGTQTSYFAWYYTHPSTDSHIRHDNYHTGFVLDSLFTYMKNLNDYKYIDTYKKGLKYYKEKIFFKNGQPKWMADSPYPTDIHSCSQGIITFCMASEINKDNINWARKIYSWTISEMYLPSGRFIYQVWPKFKKNFTLMRWCQGWSVFSISVLLLEQNKIQQNVKSSPQ